MQKIDRRKFLELTSVLSGTALLANQMPWFDIFNTKSKASNRPSDTVRIGFIGTGSRGKTLIKNVQSLKTHMNIEIPAVCDVWEPHLDEAVALTDGAQGFEDYREMLDKVPMDGVIIATPLHEHAHQTVHSMQSGCHVFCEKAMARTLDDVKWMYDSHLEENKILLIGHQRLFSPVYLKALKEINEGKIGPITMLRANWHRNTEWLFYEVPGGRGTELDRFRNWRLYDEYSAGMLTELGSHHFQIANWVLGQQPLNVMGHGSINFFKDGREVWDNFALVFEYPDGIHFAYDCITSNQHHGMQFNVLGNEGTMSLENNLRYSEEPPSPPAIQQLISDIHSRMFDTVPIGGATWVIEGEQTGGEFISDEWDLNETLLYLEGFIEFIKKGKAPEKLTLEGYNASTWTLLAEEATKTGRKIELPKKYLVTG
ncbi:Gfo/Idh/MocA family protein [Natronogracilivirga saccharolytica]|uniref:Gfo/Idh/MocA family oxidoreductase n=1 Tax=Natronogracilivirga saccharolytica TaxID=2812953 RepID=A0A8J7RPV4_9BACT|nr:Gfo/Idh/MocA family oxidoreductase [Natronogracilivirga saccharolytica]MBP3193968.1 Gfo/Idh/MocA family oxidoreductase [Natronogracilivirga saccharolytica]